LLSPRESAAVLSQAALFIGHDSGPMHLANAVGIPAIGIFSSRNLPGVWFPVGNERNVFYTDIECRGCQLEVCIERDKKCIRSIQPSQVVRRTQEILGSRSKAGIEAAGTPSA
jgi:heptosyltransferase III